MSDRTVDLQRLIRDQVDSLKKNLLSRFGEKASFLDILKDVAEKNQKDLKTLKEELEKQKQDHENKKENLDNERKKLEEEKKDLEESLLKPENDIPKLSEKRAQLLRGCSHKEHQSLQEVYSEMVNEIVLELGTHLTSLLQVDEDAVIPASHIEWEVKEKYKIYGLLISACNVRTMEYNLDEGQKDLFVTELHSQSENDEEYVQIEVGQKNKEHELKEDTSAAIQRGAHCENTKEVLSLTFQMLKLLPPLVVCQPLKYNEDIQDTNRVTWDEEQAMTAKLRYYRPVLVYSNQLHVAVKGLIGNKELVGENKIERKQNALGVDNDEGTIDCPEKAADCTLDDISEKEVLSKKAGQMPDNFNPGYAENDNTIDCPECRDDITDVV